MARLTAVLAVAIMLAAPSVASAARLTVTTEQADRAAHAELSLVVAADDEDNETAGSTFDLDPCEQASRIATCEFTIYYASGDACDGEAEVRFSRRGRLVTTLDEYYCDSDDAPVDDATS